MALFPVTSNHRRRADHGTADDGEGNLLLGAVERGHREGVDLGLAGRQVRTLPSATE